MPLGYGPGVSVFNGTAASTNFWPWDMIDTTKCAISNDCRFTDVNGVALANNSWFGHYPLLVGTVMLAHPFGVAYGNTPTQSATSSVQGFGAAGIFEGSHPSIYDVGYGIKANATLGNYGGGQYYYAYGNSYISHPTTTLTTPSATFFPSVGPAKGSQTEDAMMGMLGGSWNYLRPGDTVNVKIIYTPSGKTIVNRDVIVEG